MLLRLCPAAPPHLFPASRFQLYAPLIVCPKPLSLNPSFNILTLAVLEFKGGTRTGPTYDGSVTQICLHVVALFIEASTLRVAEQRLEGDCEKKQSFSG